MNELTTMFRGAMRRIAATVNVVTITVDGVPMGMTATAVSSLSADPPSLLVCVNQSASMHDSLALASHFCVNVLHHDQVAVAKTFSDSALRDVRFAEGGWRPDDRGPPVLPDAQASLICERSELITFATHTICIGTVVSLSIRDDVDPLVYVDGRFCQAA
jgi:flavin reductase